MPEVDLGDVRLYYQRQGVGEAALWISGFGASSAIFDPVIPRHADRFDCITFDNRGTGRSAATWRPTSIPELANDAAALLDRLDVPSAHVIGISMGGMIAQELAIRFPHRVRGLVLGCTTPGGPRAALPGPREIRALMSRVSGSPPEPERLAALLFSEAFRRERPDRVREALQFFAAHPARSRGMVAQLVAIALHDTSARLSLIESPTLVLHGDQDVLVPASNARLLADGIPDAEMHVLEGAGHAYGFERPEEARRTVAEWFDRRSPIASGGPRRGLTAVAEPLTRAMAVPLGAVRVNRSLALRLADAARRARAVTRSPR